MEEERRLERSDPLAVRYGLHIMHNRDGVIFTRKHIFIL